jgi:hypothetical protein
VWFAMFACCSATEFVHTATNKWIQRSYRSEYSKINDTGPYIMCQHKEEKSEYKRKILRCGISVVLIEFIIIGEIFVLLLCVNSKKKQQIPLCIWCKSEHRNVYFNKQGMNMYRMIVNKAWRLEGSGFFTDWPTVVFSDYWLGAV